MASRQRASSAAQWRARATSEYKTHRPRHVPPLFFQNTKNTSPQLVLHSPAPSTGRGRYLCLPPAETRQRRLFPISLAACCCRRRCHYTTSSSVRAETTSARYASHDRGVSYVRLRILHLHLRSARSVLCTPRDKPRHCENISKNGRGLAPNFSASRCGQRRGPVPVKLLAEEGPHVSRRRRHAAAARFQPTRFDRGAPHDRR